VIGVSLPIHLCRTFRFTKSTTYMWEVLRLVGIACHWDPLLRE
jgi:hypothetical protein